MKYADLHVHTFYSDSTFSPEEVVACAKDKGLSAVAICDHDSTEGIEPCIRAARQLNIEIIPGIEFTVEKSDVEIHILGYFMDYKTDWLQKKLAAIRKARIERLSKMVSKLNDKGIPVKVADVLSIAGKGTVGRLHLAQTMFRTKKIRTIQEAFDKYIGFMKPCYVANVRFSPQEAIGAILKTGGVPVLAHPHIMGRDEYIPDLINYGLRGIEVYHTDHKPSVAKHYEALAKDFGLLITGGSDCHGLGKGRVLLGGVRVPYTVVEKLKEEAQRIRKEQNRPS
ncbi:MAG: PHP domain-containing protein [Candidatus Omnitrophica bacterium]|nr:PHP domain-containing protein [Candidatus Omnitrophota bacterium]MCM8790882.1 PHP domain-containing protein [Candidatus Omnitrophota bacterium]